MKQLQERGLIDYAAVAANLSDDNPARSFTPPQSEEKKVFSDDITVSPLEDRKSKDLLLSWCKTATAGYPNFPEKGVRGFTKEWKSGVGFCAIVHHFRPDLLDFMFVDLTSSDAAFKHNIEMAYHIAQKEFDIPIVFPADALITNQDQNQIILQIWEFYKKLHLEKPKGSPPKSSDLPRNLVGRYSRAASLKLSMLVVDSSNSEVEKPIETTPYTTTIEKAENNAETVKSVEEICFRCKEHLISGDQDCAQLSPDVKLHWGCVSCYTCGRKFRNERMAIIKQDKILCDMCSSL